MSRDDELIRKLSAVIRWELDAQAGVERAPDQIPDLVADSILDYFKVQLREGADIRLGNDGSIR
jgi:hypothetical protein